MPVDEALALFLRRPPAEADRLIITAHGRTGQAVVQDVPASEVTQQAIAYANAVAKHAKQWAAANGHETRFLACWHAGPRVLGSYQWTAGMGGPPLDGTTISQVAQAQQHEEVMMRVAFEVVHSMQVLTQSGAKDVQTMLLARIAAQDKEIESLRERLRVSEDVDAQLLTQTAEADLERRARTQAILEERVLPLMETVALRAFASFEKKHLNGSVPPAAAAQDEQQQEPTAEQ